MAKPLDEGATATIRGALAETNGVIRRAEALLKERGTPYGFGTIQKIAKGQRPSGLDPEDPLTRSGIIKTLRKGWANPAAIAERLHCAEAAVREAIHHLEAAGYNILWDGPRAKIAKTLPAGGDALVDGSPLIGGWKTFGAISDTHLCSHYERLDVVEAAYDEFKRQGIKTVFHGGNIVDGQTHFNQFELHAHGVTDQAFYCVDHYPQRAGIHTHFIGTACHEGWWLKREGLVFGQYLELLAKDRGRKDLHYMGFEEVDVALQGAGGESMLRIFHPGGGTAYATSYATQKIVESLQGGNKPAVMLVGHFHKHLYHVERNVHVVQLGCAQDQTRWMRGKRIAAHIGFWVIRLKQDKKGAVRRFQSEWFPFYDRKYHVVMTA